jgi:hypothetical protein
MSMLLRWLTFNLAEMNELEQPWNTENNVTAYLSRIVNLL